MAVASSIIAAGLAAAGAVGAAAISGDAADDYADQQRASADRAGGRLDAIYDQTRRDVAPTINMGQAAAGPLAMLMGLNPTDTPMAQDQAAAPDWATVGANPVVQREYERQRGMSGGKGAEILAREGVRNAADFARYVYDRSPTWFTDVGISIPTMGGGGAPAGGGTPGYFYDPTTGQARPTGGGMSPAVMGAPAATSPAEYLMNRPGVSDLYAAGEMDLGTTDPALRDEGLGYIRRAGEMDLSTTDPALRDEALGAMRRAGSMDLDGAPLTYEDLTRLPGWDAMMRASNDAIVQSAYAGGRSGGAVLTELADRARRDAYSVYNTEMDRRRQAGLDSYAQQLMLGENLYGVFEGDVSRDRTANLDAYGQAMDTGGSLVSVYGDEVDRNRRASLDTYNQRRQQGLDLYGAYGSEVGLLQQLMSGGTGAALNLGSLGSGNAVAAGNFQAGVPQGGNMWANLLAGTAGYFSGEGGQDLTSDLAKWWSNRNSPPTNAHHVLPGGLS